MTNPRELAERLRAPAIWQSFATEDSEPEIRRDPFEAAAAIKAQDAEITRLRGLLEEAKGVLGPFANIGGKFFAMVPDDAPAGFDLQASDFRAASSLLKRLERQND